MDLGNSHDYICPKCHEGTDLKIAACMWVNLLPEGVDHNSDTEWEEDSDAMCGCGWEGVVADLDYDKHIAGCTSCMMAHDKSLP